MSARKRLLVSHLRAVVLLQRRAGDSNPQPLAGHLISSQAASHSLTLRVCPNQFIVGPATGQGEPQFAVADTYLINPPAWHGITSGRTSNVQWFGRNLGATVTFAIFDRARPIDNLICVFPSLGRPIGTPRSQLYGKPLKQRI